MITAAAMLGTTIQHIFESVLAHQAKTQPQSIILEAFKKKDKSWQSADSK